MKKDEFINHITDLVNDYINYYVGSDEDPQIRVNPAVVEEAAAADDSAAEDADDYQAAQDPDYYTVRSLVLTDSKGNARADAKAIEALAATYFK